MSSAARVRNLPAFGALLPVAVLSALVGLLLIGSTVSPALAGSALSPAKDVSSYRGIHWSIVPNPTCPDSVTRIQFDACRCNVELIGVTQTPNGPIALRARIQPYVVCGWCDPDTLSFLLGKFAAGNYVISLEIVADIVDSTGETHLETNEFVVPFFANADCHKYPGRILPYLDEVGIGKGPPCEGCPPVACAAPYGIPVSLAGTFPDGCTWLREVRTVPSPIVGPGPEPEMVQIYYGYNSCTGVACPAVIVPWRSGTSLSPLPSGSYGLIVETYIRDECDGSLPHLIGQTVLPFVVEDCATTPPTCYDARFVQRPGGVCDDFVDVAHPGHATFEVASSTALAGLQGAFRFDKPGLRVTHLETAGSAVGMRLFWNSEPDGATFVLYSDNGQLILPRAGDWSQPWEPVLNVTVEPTPERVAIDQVRLHPRDLVAADSVGRGVPGCIHRELFYQDIDATFCSQGSCDANHDGQSDVRDLVVMAMCIWGGICPDTTGGQFDCDGNGTVDLTDVMCCARHVLNHDGSGGGAGDRDEPRVSVALGAPRRVPGGCDVPLTLEGANLLGAARLDLAFPTERYDAAGVDFPSAPGWLALSQQGEGRIGLAWIAAGSSAKDTEQQSAMLHLRLKAGATDGGDLTLSASQFAAPDGAGLRVSVAGLSLPLAGGPVALSAPLPNPTAGETRFSVILAQDATLDVGVFDAGGRRIATVFHGSMPAGARTLSWNGHRDSGEPAGSGLFFLRAESKGVLVSRKVLLLSPR